MSELWQRVEEARQRAQEARQQSREAYRKFQEAQTAVHDAYSDWVDAEDTPPKGLHRNPFDLIDDPETKK